MDVQRVYSGDMPTRVGPVEYVYIDGTISRYVSYVAWRTDPTFKVEMDDSKYNNWETDYYLYPRQVDQTSRCGNLNLNKVTTDEEQLKNDEEAATAKRLLHECMNKAKNKTKVSSPKRGKYVLRHKDKTPRIENTSEFPDIKIALSKRKTKRMGEVQRKSNEETKERKWRPRNKRFSWN